MHKKSLPIVKKKCLKMGVKNGICMILKPKTCCMRNARFEVRDCMRKVRFKYLTAWKRCGSKCAVWSTIWSIRIKVLRTTPFSYSHILRTTHFSCSHVLQTAHFSCNTFLASKSYKCHFWHSFSNKFFFLTIGNDFLCTFKKDYEKKSFCGGVPLMKLAS